MTRPSICDLNKGWVYYMPRPTKRYAIQVANQQEFDSAVRYFEGLGYEKSHDCAYNGNYIRYVAITAINEISGSDGTFVFNDSLRVYQFSQLCSGKENTEMEKEVFKIGDIVNINDCSYNLLMEKGSIKHLNGLDCQKTSWVVKCVDKKWPIDKGFADECVADEHKENDLLVSDINNVNRFLVTNSLFCRAYKPIMIGKDEVKFNTDGSITVGCTTVDKDTVYEIVKKIGKNNGMG